MLSLNLKSGEYLTIGDDIYIQFFKHSSTAFRASIHAPKSVTILRGEVHERTGERPEGLHDKPPKSPSERRYDAKHYEEWIKKRELRERERQREAEARKAVMQELTEIAENMEELIAAHGSRTVKEKLNEVCSRMSTLGFADSAK